MTVGCLCCAVVVARDGARADIHLGTNGRVAQVGEMIGLRARPERGLFQLHEISDFCAFPTTVSGRKCANGPDRRAHLQYANR